MAFRKYLIDSSLSMTAVVSSTGTNAEGSFVCLNETLFHVQGGGQPADRGSIDGRPVLKIGTGANDEVFHYLDTLEGLELGYKITLSIDGEWRAHCAALHSAGHLIAALVEEMTPELSAVGGHHFPSESRVEFAPRGGGFVLPPDFAANLAARLDVVISEDQAVKVDFDSNAVRNIQIGTYTPVPCGGTHVGTLKELGEIKILKIKTKSGRIRVSYGLIPSSSAIE